MRRTTTALVTLVLLFFATAAGGAGTAAAVAPPDSSNTPGTAVPADGGSTGTPVTIDNSFLEGRQRDLTQCLGSSNELPNCGSAGNDIGGLQLATFAVLTGGLAFIAWRVVRSIRARDAALQPKAP